MDEKILIIDDDYDFLEIASLVLEEHGYQVLTADCPAIAFPILANEKVDLVLCDLHMPFIVGEMQSNFKTSFEVGIQTIKEFNWALPDLKIVGLSAASQTDLDRIAGQIFPNALLSKPNDMKSLINIVQVFLEVTKEEQPMHVV